MSDLPIQKQQLRAEMQRLLRDNPQQRDAAMPLRVRDVFMKRFSALPSQIKIAPTLSLPGELDTAALIKALHEKGHTLCLPVMVEQGKPLAFRRYVPGDALEEKTHGIREPLASVSTLVPDVVLCPLLAFDRAGHRLGRGKGYYDITLAALRGKGRVMACGFAWALQERDHVPTSSHDARLDTIVTEKEVIIPRA